MGSGLRLRLGLARLRIKLGVMGVDEGNEGSPFMHIGGAAEVLKTSLGSLALAKFGF